MTSVQKPKRRKKKKLGSYPYISVIFSIALALLVIGLFGFVVLSADKLTSIVKENVELQIYLNKYVTENDLTRVRKTLATKDYVGQLEGERQIAFVSKEDAAAKFIEETGEDFSDFLGENPLRDVFTIKIDQEYQEKDKLAGIKAELEKMSEVFEVAYVENLVGAINDNVTKVSLILMGFATILLLTVIILINNTIKLALFSQRFLIRSMQLVGATAGFVKKPFLLRSILHGIIAGGIAAGLLWGISKYGRISIPDLELLHDQQRFIMLAGILVILGGFIGFLSTLRAVSKYLKLSLDELY